MNLYPAVEALQIRKEEVINTLNRLIRKESDHLKKNSLVDRLNTQIEYFDNAIEQESKIGAKIDELKNEMGRLSEEEESISLEYTQKIAEADPEEQKKLEAEFESVLQDVQSKMEAMESKIDKYNEELQKADDEAANEQEAFREEEATVVKDRINKRNKEIDAKIAENQARINNIKKTRIKKQKIRTVGLQRI